MSLADQLQAAASSGQLLAASHDNIRALLAASDNPLYRASIEELASAGQWAELNDRFFQALKFGTGGLRGRTVGKIVTKSERGSAPADERPEHPCVGTNAMNFYNVSRATRGLVTYLKNYRANAKLTGKPSIVFAHDTRHFSPEFAKFCAKIAMDHGANVYLFDYCRATPEMSFAVRQLRADAGVMITASHNPAHDNGYKVNFNDGAGIVEPHATGIIKEVNAIKGEEYIPLPEAQRGKLTTLANEMDQKYLARVETMMLQPELLQKEEAKKLKIVFTALHGAGGVLVPVLLKTFVTSPMQDAIAAKFGVGCVNTLTGFKWISAKLSKYEAALPADIQSRYRDLNNVESRNARLKHSKFLIFGGEESYGYMGDDFSRDKDGNGAVVMFAELAAYAASLGLTVAGLLDQVYCEVGYFLEVNESKVFEGASGAAQIAKLADSYGSNPPKEVDGSAVIKVRDFRKDEITDEEGDVVLKEKMLFVDLADGRSFAVRPSGTEPKIKYYMFGRSVPAAGQKLSADELTAAKAKVTEGLSSMWAWLDKDIDARLAE